jgi:hypothetical protein
MRKYKVWIVDKFTGVPLAYHIVRAWTKRGAKRWIFKTALKGDTTYILIATPLGKDLV